MERRLVRDLRSEQQGKFRELFVTNLDEEGGPAVMFRDRPPFQFFKDGLDVGL